MNEILDLLPIPEERDFPAGQLAARRDALVAAVRVDESLARRAVRAVGKTWLSLLGILVLGVSLLTLGFSSQPRPVQRDAVTILAVAATAQLAIAVAPRAGSAVAA